MNTEKFKGRTPGPLEMVFGYVVFPGNEIMTTQNAIIGQFAAAPELLAENERLRARVAHLEGMLNLGTKVYLEQKSEIEHLRTGAPISHRRANEVES